MKYSKRDLTAGHISAIDTHNDPYQFTTVPMEH